ncbi:DUF2946 domain-containing protein [Pseudoduganella albidiflava]|uniref:DUF2946 domain-containing protein n=1 Tax=Pseudoduganella albidiflava TaxID=321983 RepID=A0A411X1D2_9BURK|nr:DUF2946 domain-containing protein [Pseudoduganella albidiflava]QBI02771.1 DUF2946 domain-containing protein [Pseudoduganella albidiflava]GGY56152.1 hypothetical protein GCM10007387_43260 [Pseudoduganella albidiflava]
MKTPSNRLLRSVQAWLACCAILLNALAPAVSHALAAQHAQRQAWEICLNDGTTLAGFGELDEAMFAALTDRANPVPPAFAGHGIGDAMPMADCGYCLPHAGTVGLPPPASLVLPAVAAGAERPYLYYHAPRPLQAWASAQPRGPPFVS